MFADSYILYTVVCTFLLSLESQLGLPPNFQEKNPVTWTENFQVAATCPPLSRLATSSMKDASVQPPNSGLHGVMGWLVPQEVKGPWLSSTTTTTTTKIMPTPLSEFPTPLASSQQL